MPMEFVRTARALAVVAVTLASPNPVVTMPGTGVMLGQGCETATET